LTIIGDYDNDYGRQMEELSQSLNLQNKVFFLGKHSDVRPFIAMADLYIIPTLDKGRKEGMPMALVEAMSMSVPVLGSNISGIKFVLKDFKDLLFKAGDFKALGGLILKLKDLSFEERQKIGVDLRDYCVTHFNIKTFIQAHEDLYY